MIIDKILLKNFRNYKNLKVNFSKNINIIMGDNAQGKTNILESVYFLSITKSYRTSDDSFLINNEKDSATIVAKVKKSNIPKNLKVIINKNNKILSVNNDVVKKISDFIGIVSVVMMAPEDVNIIKGSPSDRRNIFNIELSKLSSNYILKYNEYNKLIKMRNDYLKLIMTNSIADDRYLEIITDKLIERAVYIYKERYNFLFEVNSLIDEIYKDISGFSNLHIEYKPNIMFDSFDEDNLKKQMKDCYSKNKNKEIALGMTLYGPHRDDFEFYIGNNNIKFFGSQGQQKLIIIALKLSILKVFENRMGEIPILLLDDIFSELDKSKKNKIINYINNAGQVIITTNDIRDINKRKINSAKVFEIKKNNIIEKGDVNGK